MGLCKDCRWWTQWPADPPRAWGDCRIAESEDAGTPVIPRVASGQTRALARGYGGADAYLETLPDFGCVQFEAKEEMAHG